MIQAKFSLTEAQLEFLTECKRCGFRDKSQMVRVALDHLRGQLLDRRIAESAAFYAETCSKDDETKKWTAAALKDWPE